MKRVLFYRMWLVVGLWIVGSVRAEMPAEAVFTNSLGMKFARIEAGQFRMGQDGPPADYRMDKHPERFNEADWDERPAHAVKIGRRFYMGVTEVTNAQYEQFDPQHREKRGRSKLSSGDDEAVVFVSWDEAAAFCRWLSEKEKRVYRLPTEAEWEYACRAGTTTLFYTGDALPAGFSKWIVNTGLRNRYFEGKPFPPEYREGKDRSLRVGQSAANAWGLYDMHGNVEEWCFDWYGPYEAGEQVDPAGRADGDFRVTRGGSHSQFTRMLRSANRSGRLPSTSNGMIGFRVALAEEPAGKPLAVAAVPLNQQGVKRDAAGRASGKETPSLPSPEAPGAGFFEGPQVYVKIPAGMAGPMFAWHNHSPAIVECPNGDLLAAWYSCVDEAGSELCVVAARLRKGASEWEDASPFWDGPDVNDHAPKLWFDGKQTLYHFNTGHDGNIVRTSTDNGATWSKARPLLPHGEFANNPSRTREGFIVVPHDSRGTSLILSRDEGQTWTFPSIKPAEDQYRPGAKGTRLAGIHNGLAQLADGRLMAMGRFDKEEMQKRFEGRTPISISDDWGATWTWSASEFPAISSVQRPVLIRLREGALMFCSYTDQWRDWKNRKGMTFKKKGGGEFTGYGLFAALSFDEGKTWPVRRLLTPGGADRTVPTIDRGIFTLSETMAEPCGYLAACQGKDGTIHLISSKNYYRFDAGWLRE